eukprot:CFRG0563T1
MSTTLLEDIFHVKNVNEDGRNWIKVSRLACESENYDLEMKVDINTWLYPVEIGNKYTVVLASTIYEDGRPDKGAFDKTGASSLADNYEYVMHGVVYKVDEERDKRSIYASFGGLLMLLQGERSNLSGISDNQNLYLLMRHAETLEY